MKQHLYQLLGTFLLAVAIDMIAGLHIKTLVKDELLGAAGSAIVLHYLAFAGTVWFIDEKNNWRRLSLTSAWAFGAGAGTIVVVLLF